MSAELSTIDWGPEDIPVGPERLRELEVSSNALKSLFLVRFGDPDWEARSDTLSLQPSLSRPARKLEMFVCCYGCGILFLASSNCPSDGSSDPGYRAIGAIADKFNAGTSIPSRRVVETALRAFANRRRSIMARAFGDLAQRAAEFEHGKRLWAAVLIGAPQEFDEFPHEFRPRRQGSQGA